MLDYAEYLESILHLFEYLIFYFLFSQVFKQRFKNHYVNYFVLLLLVGFNVSVEIFLGLITIQSFFVKLSALLISMMLIFMGRPLSIFILYILSFILISICDMLVIAVTTLVLKIDSVVLIQNPYLRLTLGLVSRGLFFTMAQYLITKFKDVNGFNQKRFVQLVVILVINASFIVLAGDIYFQNKSAFSNEVGFMMGILIGIFLLSYLVLKMTDDLISYSVKERDWQLQENEYQRQIFYVKNLEGLNKQMKALRHDFNHHIGCIHGMLEQGNVDSAKTYAEDLVNQAERFNVAFSTGNIGISGLLSAKHQTMLDKKIPFTCAIDVPEKMSIKPIDISIILGNGLDNAIEANDHLDEALKGIELKAYIEMEHLILKIRNRFAGGDASEDWSTTKTDISNHGYGLKNIEFVVEKYKGIMRIESDAQVFQLNIALPLQAENALQ